MGLSYTLQSLPVIKILLHASKYPASSVNGLLLGSVDESGAVTVNDVVPLFHACLTLAPQYEIALPQIEAHAQQCGNLKLVGYYHAPAKFASSDMTPVAKRVADRIQDKEQSAVVFLLDNRKLATFISGTNDSFLDVYSKDGSREWKRVGKEVNDVLKLQTFTWKSIRDDFAKSFNAQKHRLLCDFDDHLDDPAKDYLNRWLIPNS